MRQEVAYFLRKTRTLPVNKSAFLKFRMQTFQGIILYTNSNREIFKSALVYL